jgi:hypothetical protein
LERNPADYADKLYAQVEIEQRNSRAKQIIPAQRAGIFDARDFSCRFERVLESVLFQFRIKAEYSN